jgi:hypothetical protein
VLSGAEAAARSRCGAVGGVSAETMPFMKEMMKSFAEPQLGWVRQWVSSSMLGSRLRRGHAERPLALHLKTVDRESWPFGLPEPYTFRVQTMCGAEFECFALIRS